MANPTTLAELSKFRVEMTPTDECQLTPCGLVAFDYGHEMIVECRDNRTAPFSGRRMPRAGKNCRFHGLTFALKFWINLRVERTSIECHWSTLLERA